MQAEPGLLESILSASLVRSDTSPTIRKLNICKSQICLKHMILNN